MRLSGRWYVSGLRLSRWTCGGPGREEARRRLFPDREIGMRTATPATEQQTDNALQWFYGKPRWTARAGSGGEEMIGKSDRIADIVG
jgi:hypothetical protein